MLLLVVFVGTSADSQVLSGTRVHVVNAGRSPQGQPAELHNLSAHNAFPAQLVHQHGFASHRRAVSTNNPLHLTTANETLPTRFAPFFFGTFFGVAPPSLLHIHAGKTLSKLSSTSMFSWSSMFLLVLFATFSIIPVVYKGRLRERFD